jgi:16S rRNA (cytosine967-C5)-methyltransferase
LRRNKESSRSLALVVLRDWRQTTTFADALLHAALAQSDLSAQDRAFTTELAYGVIRNLRLLDFWIGELRHGQLDSETRDVLRLGLYQVALLATPSHAAVFETVALAPNRTRGLVNGVLRSADRQLSELKKAAENQPLHVRTSHPGFLVAKWLQQFGESTTEELCLWNNRPAPVYVRINELTITREDFLQTNSGSSLLPSDARFATLPSPRATLDNGTCYAQDPSTAAACDLLGAQQEDTVLDACAAPGGKTSLIAQLMANRGTIVACDRAADRLALLRSNLQRLGITNTRVVQHDWRAVLPGIVDGMLFDRILIDAPCSNTGVMRRRVDIRWRIKPDDFARLPDEQLQIVRHVIPLLRPGGVLVYSTCSIEPEENERVLERITEAFSFLKLTQTISVLPFRDQFDGAFAAQLTHIG